MNNLLTGFALALVLALVAALVGPWFIHWNAYRPEIARQASELIGSPVTLNGPVEARLLPSPYLKLRDVSAGEEGQRLNIAEVEITLSLAPLMKGEVKAERVKLVRPRVEAKVGEDGAVASPFRFREPKAGEAERFSFDRVEIVNGSIALATAAKPVAIDAINGVAEAGSLKGPFRFEGALEIAGQSMGLRAATGRAETNGDMRLRANATFKDRPELLDFDGALKVAGKPSFDGQTTLVRPAAPQRKDAVARLPWRIAARLKADPLRLGFEQAELSYGPDDKALRLAGRGALTLGAKPVFELELGGRQVDLDRAAGEGRPKAPTDLLAQLAPIFGAAAAPPIDGEAKFDIRGVVLAGDVVQDLAVSLSADDGGWRIENASATLPGGSPAKLSGAVAFADAGPGFAGRVDLSTADLGTLRRWLAGGADIAPTPVRRASVNGEVTARVGEFSIEKARVTVEGAASTGRLAWRDAEGEGGRARLEAEMTADRIDLDAFGVCRLIAGATHGGAAADIALALDAKSARFGGVEMRQVSLRASADEDGFALDRLEIPDAEGARISGSGRIGAIRSNEASDGAIKLHVEAAKLAPVVALALAVGAPASFADATLARAAAIAPVKLDIELASKADEVSLGVLGEAAGGQIDARVSAPSFSPDADTDVDFLLTTKDGRRLAGLLGVSLSPVADAAGGELALRFDGAPSKTMTGEARLAVLGVEASARGSVSTSGGRLVGEGDIALKSADVSTVLEALGRLTPGAVSKAAPGSVEGKAKLDASGFALDGAKGEFLGRAFEASLKLPADRTAGFSGALKLSQASLADIAALGLGPEALVGTGQGLPAAPFGPSPLRGLNGALDVSAGQLDLAGARIVEDATFRLAVSPNQVAVKDFAARVDGGKLTGSLGVSRADADATVSLEARLAGAQAPAALGVAPKRSAVSGVVDMKFEAQGSSKTLAGLAGALTGAGSVTLADGAIRRLDAAAIDAVEPQVEKGLALQAPAIAGAVEKGLGSGDFTAKSISAAFTASGGLLRSGPITVDGANARLTGAFTVDLAKLALDADLQLAPTRADAPTVGVSFEGPLLDPARRVDATGFTGWLSVRAVERETARIEQMESDFRERAAAARQRADEERKRQEEARQKEEARLKAEADARAKAEAVKRKADAERQKAEADRRRREAEARATLDQMPRPGDGRLQSIPDALDINPPGVLKPMERARPSASEAPALPPPIVISPR